MTAVGQTDDGGRVERQVCARKAIPQVQGLDVGNDALEVQQVQSRLGCGQLQGVITRAAVGLGDLYRFAKDQGVVACTAKQLIVATLT